MRSESRIGLEHRDRAPGYCAPPPGSRDLTFDDIRVVATVLIALVSFLVLSPGIDIAGGYAIAFR